MIWTSSSHHPRSQILAFNRKYYIFLENHLYTLFKSYLVILSTLIQFVRWRRLVIKETLLLASAEGKIWRKEWKKGNEKWTIIDSRSRQRLILPSWELTMWSNNHKVTFKPRMWAIYFLTLHSELTKEIFVWQIEICKFYFV